MTTLRCAFVLAMFACAACAPGTAENPAGTGGDASSPPSDADPAAPDANPAAPDADPAAPDANPAAPDARPGTPDAAPIGAPDAAPIVAECTEGGTECGTGRGCLAGICRDNCLFNVYCDENNESGAFCEGGLCVECKTDNDCPGTRYRCDTTSYTCVDKPFDATKTKIGMFYHTWHCITQPPYDITKWLNGTGQLGPYGASHWWGEPAEGYYCLTNDDALLTKHAQQLHDMGVDFVFVDATNHAYNSNNLNDRPVEMIIQPLTRMVAVWGNIPTAPRIVPWVPVVISDATHPDSSQMIYTMLDLLDDYPGLQFEYEGKPLIMVTDHPGFPVDEGKFNALAQNYTMRRMWAFEAEGASKWSYMEKCDQSPLESPRCGQRMAIKSGSPEQVSITTAYGENYMSFTDTATPKHHGKTFRKQFETLLDNPEIPIALLIGWNEWTVGRLQCGSAYLCDCNDPRAANGCFLDQYTIEYNRDIEPSNTEEGDFYYRLATACVQLFRSGGRCDAAHADHMCCKDQ